MNDELRNPSTLKEMGALRGSGKSWTAIQEWLKEGKNIEVTIPTIKKAYETYATRGKELIDSSAEVKGFLKKTVIDQATQLKNVNVHVNNLLHTLSDKIKDTQFMEVSDIKKLFKLSLETSKEIREQISLQAKLLNRMNEGMNTKQINKIEYTKQTIINLNSLEKEGYIKVLRKPGEELTPGVKEVINLKKEEVEELIDKGVLVHQEFSLQIIGLEDENNG